MAQTFLDALAEGEADAPWFARMAMEFLLRGEGAKAAELCLDGLRRHSDYATGQLVLAKCYASLGRNREAVLALRKVLTLVPDNAAVRGLLAEREAEEEKAFEAFCQKHRGAIGSERISLEQFFAGEDAENAVDYLLKQLDEVRRRRPQEPLAGDSSEELLEDPQSAKIITVTLAEIYASQGQVSEAIAAYRKLTELRPEEEERYAARIKELEARRRSAE
jgi:predicted Zn-dependent protease